MKTKSCIVAGLISALLVMSGCSKPVDTPFTLQIVPQELKGFAIAEQQVHYLVTVSEGAGSDPVKISAAAANSTVTVEYPDITQGGVAEVIVTPQAASTGTVVEVTIDGSRGSLTQSKKLMFEVIEGVDDRKDRAEELLELFIDYFAAEHPELNITKDTQWTGTMVSPQWLVVSHYLFFSQEWELHLEWHIMVAPSDWARVDLRKRGTQLTPSAAFEIPSVSQPTEPVPIETPAEVWR